MSRPTNTHRKRKRGQAEEEEYSHESDAIGEDATAQLSRGSSLGITSLTANQAEQYRTAGLSPSRDIPSGPFPHTYPEDVRKRGRPPKPDNPAVPSADPDAVGNDATPSISVHASLRQNHIAVLTTMMHRCLLEGDYERAGRAWALLLRTGQEMDLRRADRWGIGAEILMRNNPKNAAQSNEEVEDDAASVSSDEEPEDKPYFPQFSYTQEGFEAAKGYYERLIVQYPNLRNVGPRSLPRAQHFYPALFSAWLCQVAEARKRAVAAIELEADPVLPPIGSNPEDTSSHFSQTSPITQESRQDRLERVAANELKEARAIASRLDDLLQGPPYDHNATFLELRGMISLWLADLLSPQPEPEGTVMEEGNSPSGNGATTSPEFDHSPRAQGRSDARQRELEDAQEWFNKASRLDPDVSARI
ncbi:hypothetical protein NA57DRAFT_75817 [Rhizodiscina lignyota]|uniref:Uncharacterized protein n=1 Tax=Rhizodiscina lignyota TaxID=1504668 RepID=A0A9P4M5W7_9PEZI|nr:hypothetical protein NA57DRAFT_75817 [Rhizodiscina lignyota]